MSTIEQVFNTFISAINSHDCSLLFEQMDEHCRHQDPYGASNDREQMKLLWTNNFVEFPDYKIEVTDIFTLRNQIAAFGYASASCTIPAKNVKENRWRVPVALLALIENDKIKQWKVYHDTKILLSIAERANSAYPHYRVRGLL